MASRCRKQRPIVCKGWFRSTEDRKLRDRLPIVLMAHRGRARKDIAADLGSHRIGVTPWLNAYGERGLGGLLPQKAKGKTANIPAPMADDSRRWVIDGPAACGLDRANWTHEALADHRFKTHGIKTSRSAMHRFCSKIDLRPYRPTYRFPRADPAKQEKAQKDLAGVKKNAGGRTRAAASGCGAFPDGADVGRHAGGPGTQAPRG